MRYWSWASNEFSFITAPDGAPVLAPWIRSVGASDAAESAIVKGAGRNPLGTTDPSYTPGEGSVEVLMKGFRAWAKEVTGGGAVPLGDLDFTLNIKMKSRTEADPVVDVVQFQFTNWDDQRAQGSADPLVSTLSILITDIVRDGVHL